MDELNRLCVVVLAAGEGTRMKSQAAKVLFPVCGRPMIEYVLDAALSLDPLKVVLVVGHKREEVRKSILEAYGAELEKSSRFRFSIQEEQRGTAHAVMCAREELTGFSGHVLILYGDTPLINGVMLRDFVSFHLRKGSQLTILTTFASDPGPYGRVVRDVSGNVREIIEARDLKSGQEEISEVNAGIYLVRSQHLFGLLERVRDDNAKHEYYLTDIVKIAVQEGLSVSSFVSKDQEVLQGINDRHALALAEAAMRRVILKNFALSGVTVRDPTTTFIDWGVKIEPDATIEPFSVLKGRTEIQRGAVIGPGSEIIDSKGCRGARGWHSVVEGSVVEPGAQVGPYSHIRPGSIVEEGVLIGNFAEIKNSRIGKGSKVHHHCYIGDSELGRDVNIGAGTVTVNYDGVKKHKTIVQDGAFIGCNANLIAPVTIGKDSYVAAGSTITEDVPPESLGIARERQTNKEGWVSRRRKRATN